MSDPVIEHRVTRLETGVEKLSENLEKHSSKMEHRLDGIAVLLTSLVRVEERQASTNIRLSEGAEVIRDLGIRVEQLESQMPNLKEKTTWVTLGMLGVMALVGTYAFSKFFH